MLSLVEDLKLYGHFAVDLLKMYELKRPRTASPVPIELNDDFLKKILFALKFFQTASILCSFTLNVPTLANLRLGPPWRGHIYL